MSIISEKSLLEECSEIIEKSYSVRSHSDESLSGDDDEDTLARVLMNKMTPAVLSKLRRRFHKSKEKKMAVDIDRRVEQVMRQAAAEEGIEFATSAAPATEDPLWLDKAGFVAAVEGIFGHHKYTPHAHALFQLLDGFGTGRIRWRQLVDRLVGAGARRTRSRAEEWTPVTVGRIVRLEHCKRETIVRLVSVETDDSFVYVAVSRGCRAGVYDGDLQLLHSYDIFYDRTGTHRRVKNCWITDAVYAPDVQTLIISASDRSLTVYDVSTLTHKLTFCVTGLPNIPMCLAYTPRELAICGERGDVTRMRLLQPRAMFYAQHADGVNRYFWMELSSPPHTAYVSLHRHPRLHSRAARRVLYIRGGSVLTTCAHDGECSVRLKHLPGKMGDYVFKVARGVSCFHISPPLLAGGSIDGTVRLWQYPQQTPLATLAAPTQVASGAGGGAPQAVLDVYIHRDMQIVIAYCSNCIVHIWDIYEECLLQTVKIKFPFLGVLGKKVEFGPYCIHPGPARQKPVEDDSDEDAHPFLSTLEVSSRRSSVFQGSTGGLMLQDDDGEEGSDSADEDSYHRYNRPEVLLTCCDHVCVLQLCAGAASPPRPPPPPAAELSARRPKGWHLPAHAFTETQHSPPPLPPSAPAPSLLLPPPAERASSIPSSMLLSPSTAEHSLHDLDTLLENAGLQGILQKDFVLMRGLRHDLNKKLADMKHDMDSMSAAVSAGAPHLGLHCWHTSGAAPADLNVARYKRVMSLFPESSLTGTLTASNTSTPRKNTSTV